MRGLRRVIRPRPRVVPLLRPAWQGCDQNGSRDVRSQNRRRGWWAGTDRWDVEHTEIDMKNSTVTSTHPLAGKVHPLTGEPIEPIGVVGGREIWPFMGGAPDDDDDDDDDDQDDDDLDDEDDDDSDDDEDDSDDDDDDDDDGDLTPAQLKAVEKAANRIADKRINQMRERDRKRRNRRGRDDDDDNRGRSRGNGRSKASDKSEGPDPRDVRDARLVYREEVTEHVTLNGSAEKALASDLAKAHIASAVSTGVDPDEAGEEAARIVADHIKAVRKEVRASTISRLKRDGVLPKDYKPSQPKKTRGGATTTSKPSYEKGKAAVTEIFGTPVDNSVGTK